MVELDDKELWRRWRLTKQNKSVFFDKYNVNEYFIEQVIDSVRPHVIDIICIRQKLSIDFIIRYMDKLNFTNLKFNPYVNQEELDEKGIYVMAKLST